MGPAIEVVELKKSWRTLFSRPHEALKGVSLSVPRGAAFGLLGPNGAGKTSFIKVLLGVARPTAGEVRVLGGDPDDVEVRARIGYLPERLHLPAALSGRDVLRSMATLKRLRPSGAELGGLLQRVGLEDTRQRVGTYSKGMRQRLGLAVALLGTPELLILDEPTDGIDPLGRVAVRAVLLEEKRRGATILLNSHLLAETERVCDRVGILDQGRLVLEGALDAVRFASSHWDFKVAEHPKAAEVLTGLGLRQAPGAATWRLVGDDVEAVNRAVDGVRAAGLSLLELAPATRDLEAVLAQALAERGGAAP